MMRLARPKRSKEKPRPKGRGFLFLPSTVTKRQRLAIKAIHRQYLDINLERSGKACGKDKPLIFILSQTYNDQLLGL
jgi:hypothetical protein